MVKLCEAYRDLSEVTGVSRWNVLLTHTADFVRTLCSPDGDYPEDWSTDRKPPVTSLMALASTACLFGLSAQMKGVFDRVGALIWAGGGVRATCSPSTGKIFRGV